MKHFPLLTSIVLLSMIVVAGIIAFILFPLPLCPRADFDTRYECHSRTIEGLIEAWSALLLFFLTLASILDQSSHIERRQQSVIMGLIHFFDASVIGVGAFITVGWAANTIGEKRGIYLFYGDSGMGAVMILLAELGWMALMTVFAMVAFMNAGSRATVLR